jgi:nitrogen regulatory protein PII
MKLVVAIIRTYKLEEVQEALMQLGIARFNVTEAKRFGAQKGHTVIHRGTQYAMGFVPKIKIEVVVRDNLVDNVVDAIVRSAHTDEPGDGEVIVTGIERRTGIHSGKTDFAEN